MSQWGLQLNWICYHVSRKMQGLRQIVFSSTVNNLYHCNINTIALERAKRSSLPFSSFWLPGSNPLLPSPLPYEIPMAYVQKVISPTVVSTVDRVIPTHAPFGTCLRAEHPSLFQKNQLPYLSSTCSENAMADQSSDHMHKRQTVVLVTKLSVDGRDRVATTDDAAMLLSA